MDEELKNTIEKVFTVEEARIVEKMLEIVSKDMSESNAIKRLDQLESVLNENAK